MDDFLFVSSTFSTKFANKNPDVAKKIVVAVDKAITYINENPTVAKKYYSEFSPVDDDVEMDLAVPIYLPSTDMRVGEFQKLADRFTETGILVQSVKVGDMFWSGKEGD